MPRPVLAVCALLALTACGPSAATVPSPGGAGGTTSASKTVHRSGTTVGTVAEFGSDHRFPSGLVVSVSTPKTFQPSASAYPKASRAAAFGIAIYNESDQPYRLSGFSVRAMVSERETEQVVDATQGYTGIADADRDLPPGDMVRVTLAFVVPDDGRRVRLVVRPDAEATATAVYTGSA